MFGAFFGAGPDTSRAKRNNRTDQTAWSNLGRLRALTGKHLSVWGQDEASTGEACRSAAVYTHFCTPDINLRSSPLIAH